MNRHIEPRQDDGGFRFGLESEYLLVDGQTFRPLAHREMDFETLNQVLESIPTADLPPPLGLELVRPHRRLMHYYVEGYHLPDTEAATPDIAPKGIEIRTPPCGSIGEAVELLSTLHERLQWALSQHGLCAASLSHHPIEDRFEGPQGARTYERWQWAMQAMLTYGPDVNVSLPRRIAGGIAAADLSAKVDYYAPALTALSLASPFHCGKLWASAGRWGKSLRTFRRSVAGQPMRAHPAQGGRLEFKGFEMTHRLADFRAYFLLWLTLLLDDGLRGRAGVQSRVYDLGAVARDGLAIDHVRERAAEVLEGAARVLPRWGFDPGPLQPFADRVATRRVPADEIMDWYRQEPSLPSVLRRLSVLEPEVRRATMEPAA